MTFGISEFNDNYNNIYDVIKEADKALYVGKRNGKNCVVSANNI